MTPRAAESVLRPGASGWELWKFPAKGSPTVELQPTPKMIAAAHQLLLALPTRDILAVPIWVSSEGDASELAELELSSRHLLRRGAEVYAVPLQKVDGRSLVLALSAGDDSIAAEFYPRARTFDAPARLWETGTADAAVWREPTGLCFGFYRERRCVFFAATGEASPGPAFCGVISRAALRLRAEDVIARIPASIRLIGSFSEDERKSLANGLRIDLDYAEVPPAPVHTELPSHLVPPSARRAQEKRSVRRRMALYGGSATVIYALIVASLAGSLFLRKSELTRVRAEAEALAPASDNAKRLVREWKEFRSAIDPRAFAIDQLAAVAEGVAGDKIRLTQFTLDGGRLLLAGEAGDVAQAYQFFDYIKKSPALQDYDWVSRQPQLAGKTKVRFEMEGSRPDAKTGTE